MRHGLWLFHRKCRELGAKWWSEAEEDQGKIRLARYHLSVTFPGNPELIFACLHRYARRWPDRVRTVEQYNELALACAKRINGGMWQTVRAAKVEGKKHKPIVFRQHHEGGYFYPETKFCKWDVLSRYERLLEARKPRLQREAEARQREQEQREAKERAEARKAVEAWSQICAAQADLREIRRSITKAQEAMKGRP